VISFLDLNGLSLNWWSGFATSPAARAFATPR
jgi:hypothetical protein